MTSIYMLLTSKQLSRLRRILWIVYYPDRFEMHIPLHYLIHIRKNDFWITCLRISIYNRILEALKRVWSLFSYQFTANGWLHTVDVISNDFTICEYGQIEIYLGILSNYYFILNTKVFRMLWSVFCDVDWYRTLYNTLRTSQNERHLADDIFKCIFLNENVWFPIKFHWNLFLRVELTKIQHWFR